jgi:hypothetical protein
MQKHIQLICDLLSEVLSDPHIDPHILQDPRFQRSLFDPKRLESLLGLLRLLKLINATLNASK